MKHFDTFSGYGGFTIATKNYEKNSGVGNNEQESICLPERQEKKHDAGDDIPLPERHNGYNLGGSRSETIGFSEVEPHAIAVLKYHYPNIKNYGDINTINSADLPDFDLLTGGSPCQDLSVAGKQAGLSGARSGLFFQFIRLLKEKQPANFIWENVKGTLSSSDGWDFARVQIEMAEAGYSFQWQILNAKYFGVPQSRERVFVVGHLGNECGREIFFIQVDRGKNLRELMQNASQSYRVYDQDGIATTIASQAEGVGAKTGLYAIPEATKQGYAVAEPGDSINLSVLGSKTRRGRIGKGVAQTLDTGMQQYTVSFVDLSTESSQLTDTAITIQARYNKGYSHHSGEVSGVIQLSELRHKGKMEVKDTAPTLTSQNKARDTQPLAVTAVPLKFLDRNQKNYQGDYSFTVDTAQNGGVMQNYRIRRLTPRECERLMGLEDDWTRWGIKPDGSKYELSDSARYKLCGNGVVVNVVKALVTKGGA